MACRSLYHAYECQRQLEPAPAAALGFYGSSQHR